jgi:hypothetical protein
MHVVLLAVKVSSLIARNIQNYVIPHPSRHLYAFVVASYCLFPLELLHEQEVPSLTCTPKKEDRLHEKRKNKYDRGQILKKDATQGRINEFYIRDTSFSRAPLVLASVFCFLFCLGADT